MPISRLSGHANIDDAAIDGFTGDYSPEIMGNYCVGSFMKAFNAFRVSRLLATTWPTRTNSNSKYASHLNQ